MPSTTARIMKIGASMLASIAAIQASRPHSRKSPRGGPPALLTRMSGFGQASSTAARPASVAMSPGTGVTLAPVSRPISAAVASSVSRVRAVIQSSTPSRPSAMAQARPSPLLAAQTIALRPRNPKSMALNLPVLSSLRAAAWRRGNPGLATENVALDCFASLAMTCWHNQTAIFCSRARIASGMGCGRCVALSTST